MRVKLQAKNERRKEAEAGLSDAKPHHQSGNPLTPGLYYDLSQPRGLNSGLTLNGVNPIWGCGINPCRGCGVNLDNLTVPHTPTRAS